MPLQQCSRNSGKPKNMDSHENWVSVDKNQLTNLVDILLSEGFNLMADDRNSTAEIEKKQPLTVIDSQVNKPDLTEMKLIVQPSVPGNIGNHHSPPTFRKHTGGILSPNDMTEIKTKINNLNTHSEHGDNDKLSDRSTSNEYWVAFSKTMVFDLFDLTYKSFDKTSDSNITPDECTENIKLNTVNTKSRIEPNLKQLNKKSNTASKVLKKSQYLMKGIRRKGYPSQINSARHKANVKLKLPTKVLNRKKIGRKSVANHISKKTCNVNYKEHNCERDNTIKKRSCIRLNNHDIEQTKYPWVAVNKNKLDSIISEVTNEMFSPECSGEEKSPVSSGSTVSTGFKWKSSLLHRMQSKMQP